ncbi:MAG: hypothetical protein ACPGJS_05520 [Flammeovirgaceae bacterium]
MATITISEGQNLLDIAVRHYGSAEGVFQLIADNAQIENLNHTFVAGDQVIISDNSALQSGTVNYFNDTLIASINTGQTILLEQQIAKGWDSGLTNTFFFETNYAFDEGDTFDPEFIGDGIQFLFDTGVTIGGNALTIDGQLTGLFGRRQFIGLEVASLSNIQAVNLRNDSIVGEIRLDVLPNLQSADLAFNAIESITVGDWVNTDNVVIELRDNRLNTAAQAAIVQEVANRYSGSSTGLKIGLLNQTDGFGNTYIPDNETIQLATDLYNNHGIEIHLPAALVTVSVE